MLARCATAALFAPWIVGSGTAFRRALVEDGSLARLASDNKRWEVGSLGPVRIVLLDEREWPATRGKMQLCVGPCFSASDAPIPPGLVRAAAGSAEIVDLAGSDDRCFRDGQSWLGLVAVTLPEGRT